MQQTSFIRTVLPVKTFRHSRSVAPNVVILACSQQHVQQQEQQQRSLQLAFRAVAIAAAVYAGNTPAAAHAWDRSWRPRRHHRRMGESHTATFHVQEFFREAKVSEKVQHGRQQVQQQAQSAFEEVGHATHALRSSIEAAVRGGPVREMHMGMSARPSPAAIPGSVRAVRGSLGWLALLAAAASLIWLVFGKALSAWVRSWRGRGDAGGKWVRDRSLGGKMVWVEIDPKGYTPSGPRSQTAQWRDRPSAATAALMGAPADTPPKEASGLSSNRPQRSSQLHGLPDWWNPTPSIHVDQRYKQQMTQEAKAILKQMEDGKLLSGQDYSISALISLRQTCSDSGVSVKPQTSSGRDAMFRGAVEAAVGAAMEGGQGGQLGGAPPTRFVAGIANDLGVDGVKAGSMAVAVVAARLRGILVDAAACQRQGNEFEVLEHLMHVGGILRTFPLPESSPEADMIATAVGQRATLEERKAMFFTYGGMEPGSAATMAELMSFTPSLVMPKLEEEQEKLKAMRTGNQQ